MSQHRRTRLSALFAAAAVTLATLVPAFPAAAEDQPPAPEVTATSEPTADPTPDATEPTTEPTPAETTVPTEAPAASATTTQLVGQFVDLSDDGPNRGMPDGVRTFHATGVGYLLIAGAPKGTATLTITVEVPAGVDAADSQELTSYSITHPLVLKSAVVAQATAQMVNQTPNAAAVHKVYAVLVTPNQVGGSAAASQTAAKVATTISHADTFWSQQSGGTVHFALQGTTAWYPSSNVCTTDPGSTALWNEAAIKATAQLGYVDAPNNHLVLFFPSGTDCGGALGLGTIGYSANSGGLAWVVGTDGASEQASTAHELGHNLSLGHADWLRCSTAVPALGYSGTDFGCAVKNYGDLTDVMGYAQSGIYGGALSSAQAIRAGIWPTTAYKFAPKGTTSYTLSSVSGNAGLRSVVVEDNQGISYFVEYRNYTDEDVRALPSCSTSSCAVTNPGVRILRLEEGSGYKGMPGDDSYLIGRTISGIDRIDYVAGESFSYGGVTIKVTAVSATSAKVTVVRNFTAGSIGQLLPWPALSYDNTVPRVGDTWGPMLADDEGYDFIADSEKFQWYRSGSKIAGATKQFYSFTNADYGKTLVVKVTIASKGFQSFVYSASFGVIAKAVQTSTGTVSVPNTAPLKATPAGFPWGTTFTYQWWRDASKISGATKQTYTPVAADAGHQVKVVVTPTSAGNPLAPVSSATEDYGLIQNGGVFGITGIEKAGNMLTAPNVTYKSNNDGPITVNRAYQWYRKTGSAAAVAITGATGSTYTLTGADTGKTVQARVIASAPGYVSLSGTASTGVIAAGKIQGSLVGPNVNKTGTTTTTIKLTAVPQVGSVTEAGVTYSYQWYRSVPAGTPELAISKATKSSYVLTTADYNKLIFVKITVKKTGYATEVLDSGHQNYSVTASTTPVISGTAQVGEFVHSEFLTYGVVGPLNPPTYIWYRGTTVVQNSTDNYYQVKAADVAGKLTVKVVAANPGYLTLTLTSPPTAAVVKGAFSGTLEANVLENARVLTANPNGVAPAPTYLYQWLRNNVAISGATKVTYTLTTADYNKSITVKITATRSGYTSLPPITTATSTFSNYSVLAEGVPTVSGNKNVGQTLAVNLPSYTVFGVGTSPSPIAYQWYRKTGTAAAVAISGATASTYLLASGDLNKTISVRVTAGYVSGSFNLLPSVLTTAQTTKVLAAMP